jgi:hypothetical protein
MTDPAIKPIIIEDHQRHSINSSIRLMDQIEDHWKHWNLHNALNCMRILIRHRKNLQELMDKFTQENKNYDCPYCKRSFPTKRELEQHDWQQHER